MYKTYLCICIHMYVYVYENKNNVIMVYRMYVYSLLKVIHKGLFFGLKSICLV